MTLSKEHADKFVADVQTAHRVAVGFYQRLLPSLDSIATSMEFDFWYWEPLHTKRPCTSGRQPTKNWLWDMVPLYASRHVYKKLAGGNLQPTDKAILFDVYIDDEFKPEKLKAAGMKEEPDAVLLKSGKALLSIEVYRGAGDSCSSSFESVWDESDVLSSSTHSWQSVHQFLEGKVLTFDLADLIAQPDKVTSALAASISDPK